MRLFFPILLLLFAAICASCGRRDFLSEDFGLSPADLENPRVVANGLAVVADCRKADFEKIRDLLESEKKSMCQYFTVDDLKYLHRGGRLSGVAAAIGSLLNIKPILTGDEGGRIVSCGKVRGKKAALSELANRYAKLSADRFATIGIAHGDDPAGAAQLLELLREKGFEGECINVCYEPVTGAHVGPGTVALFFRGIHK